MKFTLKTLLLTIIVLAFIMDVANTKSSRRHKKRSHNRVSDDKSKATQPKKVDNPLLKKDKKDDVKKICCHLQFKDEQSKLAGSVTSIHVWGSEAKCKSSPKVDSNKTALSKEECAKQKTQKTGRRY